MRFMVIVKGDEESESGQLPSAELLEAMGNYNQQLIDAGVMSAGEGLQATSKGARVTFGSGGSTVAMGPFPLTADTVAGYWMWTCGSLADAIAWLQKAPFPTGTAEIRQVFEMEDFGSNMSDEVRAQETRQREQIAGA